MDKDRAENLGAKIAGSVKEAIGKVTGDTALEAEGSAQKAASIAVVGAKRAVRDTVKR